MTLNTKTAKNIHGWDLKLWLWVFLCSTAIFFTIPLARSIQKFTSDTVGREFFTYSVLFVISAALSTLLYFLFFKLKIKSISQYIWLFFCGGSYVYFTLLLKENPEESVHLLEYGLLAFFVFRALNRRIRDWTVYSTAALMVSFIGTVDEFIQWMMPGRYWDYRDVGINAVAGSLFLLAVCKGIRPDTVSGPSGKFSVRILVGAITLNLVFLGLCLSNTPDMVNTYTSKFTGLSWLRNEEPMAEYGHKYKNYNILPAKHPGERPEDLQKTASPEQNNSKGKTDKIITSFSMKTAWLFIILTLTTVWISAGLWQRKLATN